MWGDHRECLETCYSSERRESGKCASDLWDWNKNILGDLERRIKFARKKLELCRRMLISAHTVGGEQILKYKLEGLRIKGICIGSKEHRLIG